MKKQSAHQIILLRGGLGNQLFQIAMGFTLEREFKKKVLFSDLMLSKSVFSRELHRQNWASQLGLRMHKTERGVVRILRRLVFSAFNYISHRKRGHLEVGNYILASPQSEPLLTLRRTHKWLDIPSVQLPEEDAAYRQVIRLLDQHSGKHVKKVAAQFGPFVAVHIRVGDYLQLQDVYGEVSSSYLRSALAIIERESGFNRPVLLFCEDKSQLAQETLTTLGEAQLAGDFVESDFDEFQLLRRAGAIVGCNSSFSWWAAKSSRASTIIFPEELKGPPLLLPQQVHATNWKRVAN